ncbi:exo-alpha-sialidase [Trypanosoma cruzi]|nr:exo-alpha-sialidase [Trypanosoma cruzi]
MSHDLSVVEGRAGLPAARLTEPHSRFIAVTLTASPAAVVSSRAAAPMRMASQLSSSSGLPALRSLGLLLLSDWRSTIPTWFFCRGAGISVPSDEAHWLQFLPPDVQWACRWRGPLGAPHLAVRAPIAAGTNCVETTAFRVCPPASPSMYVVNLCSLPWKLPTLLTLRAPFFAFVLQPLSRATRIYTMSCGTVDHRQQRQERTSPPPQAAWRLSYPTTRHRQRVSAAATSCFPT